MTLTNADGTPRVTASMHPLDETTGAVRVHSRFATTPEDLWEAITDPARLARWICVVEGDLRLGGTVHQRYVSGWEGDSVIEACDPPRELVIAGTDEEYQLTTRLTARITPDGDGAILWVEDAGLPLDQLPFHTGGWQVHLEDLVQYLELGRDSTEWRERWEARMPQFQAMPAE
ncbi:MAG: SRPBCC domain-containing protein [Actinomycetales bacterium]|nr:SRPBCC domain-containing protein [Actinomycetales bacterium]